MVDITTEFPSVGTAVQHLAGAPCHRPSQSPHLTGTPHRRPLDQERLAALDWTAPLAAAELSGDRSLVANRLLASIYESDLLFLPNAGRDGERVEFAPFYGPDLRARADLVRPSVEAFVFEGLEDAVEVTGRWDCARLEAHMDGVWEEAKHGARPVLEAIGRAPDRRRAAELMICQWVLDALTEASAMGRNLAGTYGYGRRELSKLFVDEFGDGAFGAKRGTLFARMCATIGLSSDVQRHWFFYLPAWLAVHNYLHRVVRNRVEFFRYVGAMAYLQVVSAPAHAAAAATLREVYGDDIDTGYCDEHAHLGYDHARQAVQDLVLLVGRKHGAYAIGEMVRGVEEIRWLAKRASNELAEQINWRPEVIDDAGRDGTLIRHTDSTPFETQVADTATTISVCSGSVDLYWSPTGEPLRVGPCQAVLVPAGRLYGIRPGAAAIISMLH
jgi:hypothetical protein